MHLLLLLKSLQFTLSDVKETDQSFFEASLNEKTNNEMLRTENIGEMKKVVPALINPILALPHQTILGLYEYEINLK